MNKVLLFPSLSVVFILILSYSLFADIPPRPSPPQLVNDLANVLTQSQKQEMEYKLRLFHHNTSNQIVVLTVKSLNGYDAASYAFLVGEKWGVGQKDFNNGIVILVKPKYANSDRGEAFIAIGYGLEPAIPDGIAKRIVENEMIPLFKNNEYFTGIENAVEVLMEMASGELSVRGYNKKSKFPSLFFFFLPFFILFILLMIWIWGRKSPFSLGKKSSFWTNLWLLNHMNDSHSGSWNSFRGIDTSFGAGNFQVGGHFGGGNSGGFDGSFSGFGGGSFGGGGAGGSW